MTTTRPIPFSRVIPSPAPQEEARLLNGVTVTEEEFSGADCFLSLMLTVPNVRRKVHRPGGGGGG